MPFIPTFHYQTLPPDLCTDRRFDCLATLKGEILLFKKEHIWKLTEDFRIKTKYPVKLQDMFPQLPDSVKHIDAAYERYQDNTIVLFNGK